MKIILLLGSLFSSFTFASDLQLTKGKEALEKMQGCYLVDFTYAETESLKPGYILDGRVYDVNKNKSIKEWIYLDKVSETEFRLQHVMFATDLNGKLIEGTELKHTGEDWVYNAEFLHDFSAPLFWEPKSIPANTWTRKITNLDDGLRYQCAANWNFQTAYPEWTCSSYSPIPGREYRDMGRKDYNTLDRTSRLIVYGGSWLERQENIKTIHGEDNSRTPLAKEVGKNWYVKLPDSECAPAQEFMTPRKAFWSVLRDSWREVFAARENFKEKTFDDGSSRYFDLLSLEYEYMEQDLSSPPVRDSAKKAIKTVISKYRE
ncbi:MAG: DUF6607 family protein [Pseudobdellovibrionaceae bacterium]